MKTKYLITIISSALFGALIGGVISTPRVSASFLEDLLRNIIPDTQSQKTSPMKEVVPPTPIKESPKPIPYYPTVDYEEAIIKAVEKASPSVVSIVISKDLPVIENCPINPYSNLPPEFSDLFGGNSFSVPCQKGTKKQDVGGGSGFIISSDGMILTNKHVVSDKTAEYTVLTNDGKKFFAEVLARDPVKDIAIIKINATSLPTAELGDSSSIRLGQTAIAIGNALGEFRNTVSIGAVSGLARTIRASGFGTEAETLEGVIQTDAAINPGNSGGPLLNLRGQVIGVNTAVASGAQSIGFAIPINEAKRDINSVKKTGSIKTPYLGVRYIAITKEIAKSQNLPLDYGALVKGSESGVAVAPNSPANKVGIQSEDIIVEINKEKIEGTKTLAGLVQKYNVGDKIVVKLYRGNKVLELQVVLEERPSE